MTVFQRIKEILFALLMILIAYLFYMYETGAFADRVDAFMADLADIEGETIEPPDALTIILIFLAFGLAIKAIREIIYYFSMARHMVGGKMILFQGVVVLDFALFTASLANIPKAYGLLYLVGIHAFSGVVEILRAMEARRTVEGPWKLKFVHGVIDFLLAALCLIFIRDIGVAVAVYCVGLVYSAIVRIIIALRKTAFVLIE